MLVFEERGVPEYPEKNLSEQRKEPTTNLTHILRRVRESIPSHIGGRRVLSPLRHPCSPTVALGLSLNCLIGKAVDLPLKSQLSHECSIRGLKINTVIYPRVSPIYVNKFRQWQRKTLTMVRIEPTTFRMDHCCYTSWSKDHITVILCLYLNNCSTSAKLSLLSKALVFLDLCSGILGIEHLSSQQMIMK